MHRSCSRSWVVWILILAQVIISPEAEATAEEAVDALPKHIRQAMESDNQVFCPKVGKGEKCEERKEVPCANKLQTAFSLNCPDCPNKSAFVCLYVSCNHSDFDRANPPGCLDCSKQNEEVIDCGCPKWTCVPKNCTKIQTDNDAVTCDACQKKILKRKCGCDVAECVPRKPTQCPSDCGACKECVSQPFKPVGCRQNLGKESFCRKKKCPEKKCAPCQQLKSLGDDDACGCPQYQCVEKKSLNLCDAGDTCSNACHECTLMPDAKCPRSGTKMCTERTCNNKQSPPSCPKCKELKTTYDNCGCPTYTCEWTPDVNNCGLDNCAGDSCKECKRTSTCTDVNGVERAFVSQCEMIPPPPRRQCDNCSTLVQGQNVCGHQTYTCTKKECAKLPRIPSECPDEDCMEPYEKTDDCNCPSWACRTKPAQPRPETCGAEMSSPCPKCHVCRLVQSGSCGAWESTCFEGCSPFQEKNLECWNAPQYDECGCRISQSKKDCPSYPEPQNCKNGGKLVETTDPCGCPRKICHCKDTGPTDCGRCKTAKTHITAGGCLKTVCELKEAPIRENLTCGVCQVLDAKSFDGCNFPIPKCMDLTRLTCMFRYPDDPDSCPEGQTLSKWKDECNCQRRGCETACDPDDESCVSPPICKSPKICNGSKKCKKYGKCPESCTASSSSLSKLIAA